MTRNVLFALTASILWAPLAAAQELPATAGSSIVEEPIVDEPIVQEMIVEDGDSVVPPAQTDEAPAAAAARDDSAVAPRAEIPNAKAADTAAEAIAMPSTPMPQAPLGCPTCTPIGLAETGSELLYLAGNDYRLPEAKTLLLGANNMWFASFATRLGSFGLAGGSALNAYIEMPTNKIWDRYYIVSDWLTAQYGLRMGTYYTAGGG